MLDVGLGLGLGSWFRVGIVCRVGRFCGRGFGGMVGSLGFFGGAVFLGVCGGG